MCACAIDCVTVNKMAELAGADCRVVFFRERAYARRKGGPGKIRSGSRDYAESATQPRPRVRVPLAANGSESETEDQGAKPM